MRNILVAVDFSDVTPALVQVSGEIARAMGAELCLVHAAAPDPDFVGYEAGPESVRKNVARGIHGEHEAIRELENRLREGGLSVKSMLVRGPAAEKVLAESDRLKADLIVIGSHGHGALRHLLMGSVGEGVLRKARCPVLVVPSPRK